MEEPGEREELYLQKYTTWSELQVRWARDEVQEKTEKKMGENRSIELSG